MILNPDTTGRLYYVDEKNRLVVEVRRQEDGNLFLTVDGETPWKMAGKLIKDKGGQMAFLAVCRADERPINEFGRDVLGSEWTVKKQKHKKSGPNKELLKLVTEDDLLVLTARWPDGIPSTVENIRVLGRYMAAHAGQNTPVPYLDCDYTPGTFRRGQDVYATVRLEKKIPTGNGCRANWFIVDAPKDILPTYTHI